MAPLQLQVHVLLDQMHRHMAGAFDHHLHIVLPGNLSEFAQSFQFSKLRFIVGIVDRTRAQTITKAEAHVVALHDLADILEMGVEEALLVMRQTPLCHDRTAARHDAGHAFRGHRHVAQQHAGMDREIVHALFGLFDQSIPEYLPGQVFSLAVHFFQCLVDRHRADGYRRIADDPFAGFVDVLAGGQVHHRVAAPAYRPGHLLHFFLDARAECGIADVGVDLDQKIAADDHRLDFGMIDVEGDDGATHSHFAAHEFRRDLFGHERAEVFTGMLFQHHLGETFAALVLAYRDVFHLRRDDAGAGIVHLRHVLARLGATRCALEVEAHLRQLGIVQTLLSIFGSELAQRFGVAALGDPAFAQRGQAGADVDLYRRVGVRAGTIVHIDRRIDLRTHAGGSFSLGYLAHRHQQIGAAALH